MQDEFLKALVEGRDRVTVYLVNGIRLVGQIESYDQYGVVMSGSTHQFVFKHAISTIVPSYDIKPATADSVEKAVEEPTAKQPEPGKTTTLRPRAKRTPSPSG